MRATAFQISKNVLLIYCCFLFSCSKSRTDENDLYSDQLKGAILDATFTFYDLVPISPKKFGRSPDSKYSFHFNEQGNIVEQAEYVYKNNGFVINRLDEFTYNDEGQRISTFHGSHPNPYIKVSYEKGVTETDSLDESTGAILKKTLSISVNDTLSTEQQLSPAGKNLGKVILQIKDGRVASYKVFNENERQEAQYFFQYDSAYRIKSRIYSQNNKSDTLTYSYQHFDQHGNYLDAITYYHGKPHVLEERILTYYKK